MRSKYRRRKTSLHCYLIWFLHWCGVGLSSRHKNSTGRSSYVVRDGMCCFLAISDMFLFISDDSFWLRTWYIECCVETFVHGEVVLIVNRCMMKCDLTPVSTWQISHVIDNRRYSSRARQKTQDHPNLSIARPIPCFGSSQSAGSDN